MNKTPSILVDTGFEVDQSGALTELDVPNVVDTLNAPSKVVFNGTTINYVPSTTTALQEISAPNATSAPKNFMRGFANIESANFPALVTFSGDGEDKGAFYGCAGLTSVNLQSLTAIDNKTSTSNEKNGMFYGCTGLTSVNLPSLTSIRGYSAGASGMSGAFYGCASLVSIALPALTVITQVSGYVEIFGNCTALTSVYFPSLISISDSNSARAAFANCTNLADVQFGSEGHAVTSLGQYTFANCTQSGLTITIYTNGGTALSGSPWGATNATIVWEEA